jgi:hypothetical protein
MKTNTRALALAYLNGVIHGDGWYTTTLGLRVADLDFAQAFVCALRTAFGVERVPRPDERGYSLVRIGDKRRRFAALREVRPELADERAAWLRGLFDSEGNADLSPSNLSENSWNRSVRFFSTERSTLVLATQHLAELGIATKPIVTVKPSAGHKGRKPVYRLHLRCDQANFARFAELVGSSIGRKAEALRRIPLSYRPDTAYCRTGQARGAATRRRRALEIVLPAVLAHLRRMLDSGQRPTQRGCSSLPGYAGTIRYVRHAELVRRAKELPSCVR